MEPALYSPKTLDLTRRHFINSYPPFNVTRQANADCLQTRRDLLLYVHIPFCPTICTYCFYKKFGNPSQTMVETYLSYLYREIQLFARRPEVLNKRVKTLYIGGGTPTTLTSPQLTALVACLREHLDLSTLEEFCCEMMPDEATAAPEKLATLKDLGVTRISFGVETLNDSILRLHNRRCTQALYDATYQTVRDLGFEKINIDMMSGLAGETWESWTSSIEKLLEWNPPSISIYKFEVFYNTTMFSSMRNGRTPPALISDEEEIRHIRYAHETLCSKGSYIVANCLHLLKDWQYNDLHYRSLWQGGELKGLGLSAHSSYEGFLHQNAADLPEYYRLLDADRLPVKRSYQLTARDRISQAMVYGLKNLAIERKEFISSFGVDLADLYAEVIDELVTAGVLSIDDQWLRITPDYYIFADDICRQFFLPEYQDMIPAHVDRSARAESLVNIAPSRTATPALAS